MAQNPSSPEPDQDTVPTTLPSWAQIVGEASAAAAPRAEETQPSRRELREREAAHAAGRVRTGRRSEPVSSYGFTDAPPKRRRRWVPWLVAPLVLVLVVGGAGLGAAFLIMPDWPARVASYLQPPEAKDYTGTGTRTVNVVVHNGDIGSDIAVTLQHAGVTKTYEAFYSLLIAEGDPAFQPGTYRLKAKMSARSALAALLDPKNKLQNQVLVVEGESIAAALESIAAGTDIPLADLKAAAADWGSFGLPPGAKSLEGFLFPATYPFDPGTPAHDALKTMVDGTTKALDQLQVAPADRMRVVILASIVQREAGNVADMPKIARVFQNRLDQGMHLQSDATVAYGTGHTSTVWTTDAERADAANPYNTYANAGLPIGPIGNPGKDALAAAVHPADGSWLFFVPVNLATGETVFSSTAQEHDAAVQRLHEWCSESAGNAAYCG